MTDTSTDSEPRPRRRRRQQRSNREVVKIFAVAAVLVGLAILGWQGWTRKWLRPKPRIVLDRTEHDFGEVVAAGQALETTVTVRNEGDDTLKIEKVSASCGCTAAVLDEAGRTLAPGASTEIAVRFDTKGRSGHQHKSVKIISNDPRPNPPEFSLEATLVPAVEIEPDKLDLGEVAAGSTSPAQELRVRTHGEVPLEIASIAAAPEDQLTVERAAGVGEEGLLLVRLRGGPRLGTVRGAVQVQLADGNVATARVTGQVTGSPLTAPPYVQLGRVARDGFRHELKLEHEGPIAVTVEALPEGLTAEVTTTDAGTLVALTCPPGTGPLRIQGDLILTTDHPALPRLLIPVAGTLLGDRTDAAPDKADGPA